MLVLKGQKWLYGIPSHIWRHGYRVEIHGLEKRFGIHGRSISDITTFCIRDGEYFWKIFIQIFNGPFQGFPSLYSMGFIKSSIGLIGYGIVVSGINDRFVK